MSAAAPAPAAVLAPARVAGGGAAGPGRSQGPFQWKWALLAIPICLGIQVIGGAILGLAGGPDPVLVILVAVGSFFLGGLLIAYWSPGVTVREPAVGIAAGVLLANLLLARGESMWASWLFPLLLGFAGAKLGEMMQARRRTA